MMRDKRRLDKTYPSGRDWRILSVLCACTDQTPSFGAQRVPRKPSERSLPRCGVFLSPQPARNPRLPQCALS